MCGIQGILSYKLSRPEIRRRLEGMASLQRHRGPDDQREAFFRLKEGWLGFGLVRLSILDLQTGMQPIICPKDNTAIICNGQVYNYVELKPEVAGEPFTTKGDIEVALHLYRKRGIDFLGLLNGMYGGAIYDPPNNKLILFRDRFGIKPLYYTERENGFFFSSEIKPLLYGSRMPVRLNRSRLPTFFTYRYLPGEETMFKDVKRLPPGSYLEYDLILRKYCIRRYWEYSLDRVRHELDLDDAESQFMELFEDAVRIRLRSDVEVGALLSGGIDSSAVSSLSARSRPEMKLFTMSFREEGYDELPGIREFLGANRKRFESTRHLVRLCGRETLYRLPDIIRSLEEPVSLGTILPTDQVCEFAGSRLKVVMTGEGADEIFAGYRKFIIEMAACHYNDLSRDLQRELREAFPELIPYMAVRDKDPARRYIQSEILYGADELKRLLGEEVSGALFPEDALPRLSGDEHPLNAAIALECRSRLPDYVILRLDKLSMRHSLETRTPFLDFRLAEFAAGLPIEFKISLGDFRGKFICRRAFNRYGILDDKTALREKLPFTIPLADWLSSPSELPDFLQEILLGDTVRRQGVLDHRVVKGHVERISKHGIGPHTLVSEADRVFAVIIFTLWYDIFFKEMG